MDVQDGVSDGIMNGDIEAEEEADGLAELSKDLASRPIHKAKRLLGRRSPGKETASDRQIRRTTPPTQAKNSKKSRDGRGRGLPKKGKHVVPLFCYGDLWLERSRSFLTRSILYACFGLCRI